MKTCNNANLRVKYKHITRKRGKNMEEKKTKSLGLYLTPKLRDDLGAQAVADHMSITDVAELFFKNYVNGRLVITKRPYCDPEISINNDVDGSMLSVQASESISKVSHGKRKKSASMTIRIDPELRNDLNAKAEEDGFKTSEIIDILFENYLSGNIQVRKRTDIVKNSETL